MATKTLPDTQAFVLRGGTPTPAVDVEADLRGRVASCEAALASALWQLARFCQAVGRPADATACVDRLLAGARNPAAQATGCLRAGQLLEQQAGTPRRKRCMPAGWCSGRPQWTWATSCTTTGDTA